MMRMTNLLNRPNIPYLELIVSMTTRVSAYLTLVCVERLSGSWAGEGESRESTMLGCAFGEDRGFWCWVALTPTPRQHSTKTSHLTEAIGSQSHKSE